MGPGPAGRGNRDTKTKIRLGYQVISLRLSELSASSSLHVMFFNLILVCTAASCSEDGPFAPVRLPALHPSGIVFVQSSLRADMTASTSSFPSVSHFQPSYPCCDFFPIAPGCNWRIKKKSFFSMSRSSVWKTHCNTERISIQFSSFMSF